MTKAQRRFNNAAAARRYRRRLLARGLTYRGTTRIYRVWSELGGLRGQKRRWERLSRWRQANLAAGLRYDGRSRTRTPRPELKGLQGRDYHNRLCQLLWRERHCTSLEKEYRLLRATIPDDAILTTTSWTRRNA